MMRLSARDNERKQKTERFGGLCLLALGLFYALVCTPVYILSSTNIAISETVFPLIWDFVQDAVQFLYYWTAFAFVFYFAVQFSLKHTKGMILTYAVCSAGRYFISLAVGYLMLAGTSGWSSLGSDLLYMVFDILGDWMQMAVAVLLIYLILIRKKEEIPTFKSMRFDSPLRLSNLFLRCMLLISFIPSIVRILSRIRFDLFFGAPQLGTLDLFWMIFYYCGDVLSGVIGYLVLYLLISQLYLQVEEKKYDA